MQKLFKSIYLTKLFYVIAGLFLIGSAERFFVGSNCFIIIVLYAVVTVGTAAISFFYFIDFGKI